MNSAAARQPCAGTDARHVFYRDALHHLNEAGIPYVVGGTYAFIRLTGISSSTKDLDLFLRRDDCERALERLASIGYQTEVAYPHWLGKVRAGDDFIDLIFNSGNGLSPVDDEWIAHGQPGRVLQVNVRLCPVEEMIWTKAFVMERERFDGSDIAHLIRAHAEAIDWPRLIRRFGPNVAVLLSHLILFGFIYPGEIDRLPRGLLAELFERVRAEPGVVDARLCRGGLLSRVQYLVDLEHWQYSDVRRQPDGAMSQEQLARWTAAAPERPHPADPNECE